jgi:hypothetical protein
MKVGWYRNYRLGIIKIEHWMRESRKLRHVKWVFLCMYILLSLMKSFSRPYN